MFDFRIIGDRLGKEYPGLKTNLGSDKNRIIFSIKANSFNFGNLLFSIELVSTAKGSQLSLSGPVLNKSAQFPCSRGIKPQQKIFKRDLEDNPTDYEGCYNIINKYIPKIKEAIDYYDSVHCDHAEITLEDLEFKKYTDGGYLYVNNIIVKVILPSASYPCFVANVRDNKGFFKDGGFGSTTFDELLSKIAEED